jgi:hypothetical protein
MNRIAIALFALMFALFPACGTAPKSAAATNAMVYVCDCPTECSKCDHVQKVAGKCGCGHALVGHHVIELAGSTAKVCSCAGECACTIAKDDPTKCTCGKPVSTVSLAGKGLYTCTCGGGCGCSLVMPGPGKCGCGKDLVPIK